MSYFTKSGGCVKKSYSKVAFKQSVFFKNYREAFILSPQSSTLILILNPIEY